MCLHEHTNYLKSKITIFLIGFFIIIFSETTLRFIQSNLNENIKIMLIPIFLTLIFYQYINYKLKPKFR